MKLRPELERLAPGEPLPAYAYVPRAGLPHPTRNPRGHSYGTSHPSVAVLDPERWRDCRLYLFGIDLFNHGYYWEAHEAWEHLWHAAGRRGVVADFLKGLIILAAAGVKARESNARGAITHGRRAAELFEQTRSLRGRGDAFMGLSLERLISLAGRMKDWSGEAGGER